MTDPDTRNEDGHAALPQSAQARNEAVPEQNAAASWLTLNWDKVLIMVVSIIVSGSVGFFAALRIVDSDISMIRQDIASMKERENLYVRKDDYEAMRTTMENSIKPSMTKLQQDVGKIGDIEIKLARVETISEHSQTVLDQQYLLIQASGTRPVNPRSPQSR